MNTKILALVLLVCITAADAFADRGNRRERRNDGNGQARADRHARADRNRSNRTRPATRTERTRPSRTERTRPATRPERTRPANRTERTRPATRPNRNRTADRVPERRRVERPNRPSTRHERRTETRPNRNRPHRPVVTRPNRPNRPNRRVVSRPHRPSRSHYGTRNYHRPYRYTPRTYRRYYHSPVNRRVVHNRRYTPNSYYRTLRSSYRNYIYLNWILHPSTRNNGYYSSNGYPYYIHNGYRHRYSWNDTCNYQLIDKNTHTVTRTYWNQSCASGYNSCAIDRDNRNEREWDNRYFCAETYRDRNYNFNTPTYDYQDDYYSDNSYNNYDSYNANNSDNCYDYDWETGVCYDY